MDRILLFGGSFNPIHHGHLIVCRAVAERLRCARTFLIPSARPPHKPERVLPPAADRVAMCRLATQDDPAFEVSDWETRQSGPNYTLHTVEHFARELGSGAALHWLIGMDSLHELAAWYRAAELVEACTIVTAARPGFDPPARSTLAACFAPPQVDKLLAHIVDSPRIDIASTDIRSRVSAGLSIRYLVPEAVRQYIAERGLYRGG